MHWSVLIKGVWAVVFAAIAILAVCAISQYPGSAWVYLLFTGLSTAVLFFGFGRGAIFFDAFIGVLLWIGFWLKFSVHTAFSNGKFNISVGAFDGSPGSLDKALLVVSCALAAILVVRLVRPRFFSYPETLPGIAYGGLFEFYQRNRKALLIAYVFAVLTVCLVNTHFGIYQRGLVSRMQLPFGLNGVFSWLLMFGMASVSTLILRFEFEINRERYWVAITIALLETCLSNISLWSRGMILNGSALMFGAVAMFRRAEQRLRLGLAVYVVIAFIFFFVTSVLSVNFLRTTVYYQGLSQTEQGQAVADQTSTLFLDRWVGIEGVMAVVGSGHQGWAVFQEALSERLDKGVNSYYDQHFVVSSYDNTRGDGTHFISLPGYLAFLFYPGSFLFLFFAVMAFSLVAVIFEFLVYRLGGQNLAFCALIGQVIAFRFTSFGYVPLQSYLLFGSILLNVLILFSCDRALRFIYKH
ncbi:hypothetical protein [Pseudomonas sichuanensis]|uniref:hypothetical protein n=1 Tax=Pseudomonas sichuanensis TaxID=2213015 RepID=UPI00215F5D56|nr:hypothetical protein [Pseudomonas sichuanensis]MDZ4017812.1 hypothetical protein [Pseudomonas sichuanensis]UVL90724.1 hypothetical protein LOY51_07470 [Pseudomonas sichuanensis]